MKNSIYITIKTEKLLEGLLFLGPSCGKYLKEDISARQVRASLTLKHITPPFSPHPSTDSRFLISVGCGVALQIDAQLNWVYLWWFRVEGELLILGRDCGNGHELPWVAEKSSIFSLKQVPLSCNTHDSSSFRSSPWPWDESGSRPGGAVLLWSRADSRRSAAPVPKTRRCVSPPKKAETFRQGRPSLTRPILSLAGLLNKDQTRWSLYLAGSAL